MQDQTSTYPEATRFYLTKSFLADDATKDTPCADCGKICDTLVSAVLIRADGTYCEAHLCNDCGEIWLATVAQDKCVRRTPFASRKISAP